MESEFARRRINTIACHFNFACPNHCSAAALLPLNCSSSLNSSMTRYDNRAAFARQGSSNQTCFMRQASIDLGNPCVVGNVYPSNAVDAPLFSRPAKVVNNLNLPSFRLVSAEQPKYARQCAIPHPDNHSASNNQISTSKPLNGAQWSPRTNIAEFECKYVVYLELPGIHIADITVEVNPRSLSISNLSTTMNGRKSKILQRSFQVVWPLPATVNKDAISAEFMEGILQINIPKL